METSETLAGKRDRAPMDVAENSKDSFRNLDRRCRVGDLHLAFVAEKKFAREHTHWWNPDMKTRWNATRACVVEGADAAISAWIAEECDRAWALKPTEEERKSHGGLASAAQERGLNSWMKF